MNAGYLNEFFGPVAWKRLVAVELGNQHEFNGSNSLTTILRDREHRIKLGTGLPAEILYLRDDEEAPVQEKTVLSWYDSRASKPHRSAEYRLYYQANSVFGAEGMAKPGDLLIIAFNRELSAATIMVAEKGSTRESQLMWLFGIPTDTGDLFGVETEASRPIDLFATQILESLGLRVSVKDDDLLQILLQRFSGEFPSSATFSKFARESLTEIEATDDPDATLTQWMEKEEVAFRVLEKHIVEKRLAEGFAGVDDFVRCSLSVQNRRKSRAGYAFENHLNALFTAHGLRYAWRPEVENRSKPDFLFPGLQEYKNTAFPLELLTLLGAKTSCKDRWRQVLSEGQRMRERHLVTLEPAISGGQLEEMRQNQLTLVVPRSIQSSYQERDRNGLWSVQRFIDFVSEKQKKAFIL